MTFIDQLNWRYAAKRMNGGKVPADKLNNILEAARLAPSSMGLQPFSVIVVESEEMRKKISPAIFNQPQILEGSYVLVFAAWDQTTPEKFDAYLELIAKERNMPIENLEAFRKTGHGYINSKTSEQLQLWAAKQTYIALGFATAAAAVEQVDATPMEGFNPEALDEALGLKEKGLKSTVVLALGYRDEEADFMAKAKKVRRPASDFFIHV